MTWALILLPAKKAAGGSQLHPSAGTALYWGKLPLPRLHLSLGQPTSMTVLATLLQLDNFEGLSYLPNLYETSLPGNSIEVQLLPLSNCASPAPSHGLLLRASSNPRSLNKTSCSERVSFQGYQPWKFQTQIYIKSVSWLWFLMEDSSTLTPHTAMLRKTKIPHSSWAGRWVFSGPPIH